MADSMLIDGLIKFCDEKSKNIKLKAEPQVFIEIAQALEELKALKKEVELYRNLDKTNFSDGYNKAIDEFAEMLKEKYEEHNFDLCLRQNDYYSYSNSCMLFESYIDKIAEQMKEGGKNERNTIQSKEN